MSMTRSTLDPELLLDQRAPVVVCQCVSVRVEAVGLPPSPFWRAAFKKLKKLALLPKPSRPSQQVCERHDTGVSQHLP